MPEIYVQPELGVGDEVGVNVVYLNDIPSDAPTWKMIWRMIKWRVREDYCDAKQWVRTKVRARWPFKHWG